jgi:hypothetical protein
MPPPKLPTSTLNDPEFRQEAQAALGAYRELGQVNPEYEDAVVESFLARMDERLGRRTLSAEESIPSASYATVVRTSRHGKQKTIYTAAPQQRDRTFGQIIGLLSIVLALAIPLTAVAASLIGVIGFIVAWIGVSVIGVTAFTALVGSKQGNTRNALNQ